MGVNLRRGATPAEGGGSGAGNQRVGKHLRSQGRSVVPFGLHDRDIAEVAVELLVIETAADHETVRDFKTAELDRNLHDASRGPVEQRAERQRVGSAGGQRLQ